MDFSWTDDQLELFAAVEKYAASELGLRIKERDRLGDFDEEGWRGCAALGLQGLTVPEEWGGLGLDALTSVGALERLGKHCRDNGLIFSLNAHIWTVPMPLVEFGTEDQKKKYLPGLCNGTLIGANGTSENEAGSDAYSMKTSAKRNGDCYILNGSKTWVTNAPVADVFVVYATVNEEKAAAGVTAFLVDRNLPGLTVSKPIEKMGLRTSPMAEMFFDDCRVPVCNRLGPEGGGNALFTSSMTWERGSILACAVGSMDFLLDTCIAHARQRRQFGQSIGRFQAVSSMIVDMKLRLETSRALLYQAAWMRGKKRRVILEAAMAKLHISDSWVSACQDAIQIFGAAGYTVDIGLERELRDAVASKLYSGTSEIQRNIVASMLGLG